MKARDFLNNLNRPVKKNMETIKIINSIEPVTKNFSFYEYWAPTITPTKKDFELHKCIADAIQVLRDWFKIEWEITSVYRPYDALTSPPAHRIPPPAVDSVCSNRTKWEEIQKEIRSHLKNWRKSELVKKILATGTNVVLIESSCVHIHYRTTNNSHPIIGDEMPDKTGRMYDLIYPDGFYFGEWKPTPDGKGKNICYSV